MNKTLQGFVLVMSLFVGEAKAVNFSINEALDRVLAVDYRHIMQQNNLQSSKINVKAEKAARDFKANLSLKMGTDTDGGWSKKRKFYSDNSFTLTKNLYNGGGYEANIDGANAKVDVSRQNVMISQSKIAIELIKIYTDLLRLRRMQGLLTKNMIAIRDLRDEYSRRVEIGVGQRSILLRLDQKLGLLEISIDDLSNQLSNTEDKMRYLLQVDNSTPLDLQPIEPVTPELIEEIRKISDAGEVENLSHPEIAKIKKQIYVASYGYEAKRATNSPVIDVETKVAMKREGERTTNKTDYGVYLKVNWNLSDDANKHRIKEKEIALSNSRIEYAFAKNKILNDLKAAIVSLDTTSKRLVKMKKIHAQTASIERDSYTRFTSLAKQSREYISRADVINEFYTSEARILGGYYEKVMLEYTIVSTAGKLLNYLGKK
ncbi:MAG: TolC family protein [Alphaproteobacteria bacterium]